jgi:AcrR family transcriptional regulator
MSQTKRGQAREKIILAAHDLFYAQGLRATSADEIIAAAGVTKVTFYRHFPGKDALIRAYLDYRHRQWMDWFEKALRQSKERRREKWETRLDPLADAFAQWTARADFRGCAFLNAAAEIGPAAPEILARVAQHKLEMRAVIASLLPARDAHARKVVNAAAIAFDGAIMRAQIGERDAALKALRAALRAMSFNPAPSAQTTHLR